MDELLKRVDTFSNYRSRENEWSSLLASLQTLIPKDLHKSFSDSEKIDLESFSKTREYEIVVHTLCAFGKYSTYEKSERISSHNWVRSFQQFYYISLFTIKPQKIEFLHDFYSDYISLIDEESEFDFLSLMAENEPIFYRQIQPYDRIEAIREYISSQIEDRIREGRLIDEKNQNDDSEDEFVLSPSIEYDDWYSSTDNLLAFASGFYKITKNQSKEEIAEYEVLNDLFRYVTEPASKKKTEPKMTRQPEDSYWTVTKIFEDL